MKHRLTARMWWKDGYIVRDGAKGRLFKTDFGIWVRWYSDDEVVFDPEAAKQAEREYRRQCHKNSRKGKRHQEQEEREAEERKQREAEKKTSWQWLEQERCMVKPGSVPVPVVRCAGDDQEKTWHYYFRRDVVPVTEDQYDDLKQRYIDLFGGWETIDLETTEYDGRVWY